MTSDKLLNLKVFMLFHQLVNQNRSQFLPDPLDELTPSGVKALATVAGTLEKVGRLLMKAG